MTRIWLITASLAAVLPGAWTLAAPAEEPADEPPAPRQAARPAQARAAFPAPAAAPVPAEIPIALLMDLSSHQILFAREAGRRFMPASVVKVMTAYTAFELIRAGKLSPDARVEITEEFAAGLPGEGSTMFLEAGDRPTVGQLILGSTTVSGNDATVALAVAATGSVAEWTRLMNEIAAELGMSESHFFSPNGFPDGGRTFTTAHDLALLGEAVVTRHPRLYRQYFGHRTFTWGGITQTNHDPISSRVPGADGLKTGFTNEAGYTFLGSAMRDGRRLVLVLAGAPTSAMRDKAARELVEWGFARFTSHPLYAAGTLVGEARVQDGMEDTVMLRAPGNIAATLPAGRRAEPKLSIRYRGPLMAPIDEGDIVAQLRIETPGFAPVDLPLEAAEDVGKANAWYRLVNGLYGLFG